MSIDSLWLDNYDHATEELTPCRKLGYKEGDIFEVVGGEQFILGERVVLELDDGTTVPKFTCVDRDLRSYEYCENVKKIEDADKRDTIIEELQTQTKELIDLTNSMKEHGPIEWRDRIREIAVQMDQLQEERENLLNKLENEGFLLLDFHGYSADSSASEEKHIHFEDMSDWRNWKVGDFIELLAAAGYSAAGSVCQVLELEDDEYEGEMPALVDGPANSEWPNISIMKWHSRPTSKAI
jgi:hypothetical protein